MKRPMNEKQKQLCILIDNIMLLLLAKYEFGEWFHFSKNKELQKKIRFFLESV